jgi:hypothetical protein
MEFVLKGENIIITSEKKEILLSPEKILLDTLDIALPGEYEKSGCLMYAYAKNDEKLYHFRVDGYWIAYVPAPIIDISAEALDFLGTVDILIMSGSKVVQNTIEKIEPRFLVTYGEMAHEIATPLGYNEAPISKYKLKDADLSSDKTGCVILG